jgi:transmembrane sensor
METDIISARNIDHLIIKVLTDMATPEECVMLDRWVKQSDDNRSHYLRFRNAWLASSQVIEPDLLRTSKALEMVSNKIRSLHSAERKEPASISPDKNKRSVLSYLKIAALWIFIFGLGAVFSMLLIKPGGFPNVSDISVIAPRGSKALTILPDGTVVWLNAGSRIKYKIPSGKPAREVTLEGEAYFNVSKDPDHPFTVNAAEMVIKAYGTEFNVKAYPEEKIIAATLVKGSVSVEIKDKSSDRTMLKPNDQAIYYKSTPERSANFLVTKGINPSLYTLWINDRLQIKGETLEDLSVMLERKYDVNIHFDDNSLRSLRFTGIIENETIEQILELIKISSNVDYNIDGREIWLSKTRKQVTRE